ncbi:MAG: glycosyltransferase [Desulfurivibrionaceae bacterium]
MKLAYVVLLIQPITGIQKSIQEKARAFAANSIDIDIIVLNPDIEKTCEGVQYVRIKSSLPGLFRYLNSLFRRYKLIDSNIDLKKYDFIILRYPSADRSGIRFIKKYKIITEHHADVRSQFLAPLPGATPVSIRLLKHIRYFLEKTYGHRILHNCRGIICVTNEIRQVESERVRPGTPSMTVANGIDVDNIYQTGYKVYNGTELDLVFIASSMNPWHGLDRLIRSLDKHHGPPHITFHIIGNISEKQINLNSSADVTLRFHGIQTGKNLDGLLQRMNLAFSTLALFRNRMEEACVLKTREYTARGLPFVLAYSDPDLDNVDPSRTFFLRIENKDTPVDLKAVISFVKELSKGSNPTELPAYMRQYARDHMDWKTKAQEYVSFCRRLADKK